MFSIYGKHKSSNQQKSKKGVIFVFCHFCYFCVLCSPYPTVAINTEIPLGSPKYIIGPENINKQLKLTQDGYFYLCPEKGPIKAHGICLAKVTIGS